MATKSFSVKNAVLAATRRTKTGLTVRKIFERVVKRANKTGNTPPPYSSVRGRVYELEKAGILVINRITVDRRSGRYVSMFKRRPTQQASN